MTAVRSNEAAPTSCPGYTEAGRHGKETIDIAAIMGGAVSCDTGERRCFKCDAIVDLEKTDRPGMLNVRGRCTPISPIVKDCAIS
jgi:hypothetical protein